MSNNERIEDIYDKWFEEDKRDSRALDPVVQNCKYKHFKSNSKGKGRRRRNSQSIELVGYGQKFHMINEDDHFRDIDVIAAEISTEINIL